MKEFDFEEIDKAVAGALATDTPETPATNGVTSNASATSAPVPALDSTPTASEPLHLSVPPRESIAKPESASASDSSRSAPAMRRSSGRFMDVVHPSSDMRGKTTFTPPAPQTPAQTPEATPDAPKEDILEDWAKPLESPFLAGAKVEKRPLGGSGSPADVPLETLLLDEPDEPRLEAPDEPRLEAVTMPDPIDFATHSSVLSLEKEDTGVVAAQPEAQPVVASEGAEAPLPEVEPVKEEAPEVPAPEKPTLTDTTPQESTGPTSITQQYTEQPSSAEASGAIYDTEAYHQPVAPVVKKKSGIWVILWIFLLIVLGAGAGVAFYLFVLPML